MTFSVKKLPGPIIKTIFACVSTLADLNLYEEIAHFEQSICQFKSVLECFTIILLRMITKILIVLIG